MNRLFCPYCGTQVDMDSQARCPYCNGSIQFAVIETIPETFVKESTQPLSTSEVIKFKEAFSKTLDDVDSMWKDQIEVSLRNIGDYMLAQKIMKKQFELDGWERPRPVDASFGWSSGGDATVSAWGNASFEYPVRRPYVQRLTQIGSRNVTYVQ